MIKYIEDGNEVDLETITYRRIIMTIDQKILQLRTSKGISQEELAEMLGVSRQSVSKWEMGQALPQIDKVLQLSEIFSVSTDELLHDKMDISKLSVEKKKNKYFIGNKKVEEIVNLSSTVFLLICKY